MMKRWIGIAADHARSICALLAITAISSASAASQSCGVGVYQGAGDDFVVIVERANPGEMRYYFRDGTFGTPGDARVACERDALRVTQESGKSERWAAVPLRLTPTRFRSGDVMLEGLLIEPAGDDPKRPLLVNVHGSENSASLRRNYYPYMFAAQGIAAFVFDKRGTGASEGHYHQNFHRLAEDVVAASAEAKRLAHGRFGRFGLFGGSQGGWVAPRAANDAGAEFVAIGFGLLIDPLDEDAQQVASELRELGYDGAVLAKAKEVTDATGELMAAHFASGYEALANVKRRYGNEAWFKQIKGEFTGDVLALKEEELRREGRKRFDNLDIDWRYDAIGHLRAVRAPQLWVIAGADREAPPEMTVARLQDLRKEGRPIEIAVFPRTDHGMVEFESLPDGERRATRITDGYFRLLGDWILGRKKEPYGAGRLLAPGESLSGS